MTDEQIIKTGNQLMLFATMALLSGIALVCVRPKEEEQVMPQKLSYMIAKEEWTAPQREVREAHPALVQEMELRNEWNSLNIHYTTVETSYIGRYFVTAYSDEETYSRATASGIEVHYSDDPYEPTTCAIDRRYHRFGDLFMIDGKVYVAEDTGSAVLGAHIDCFVETMEEVWSWDTGYKSVYSVEYVENYLSSNERKESNERFRNYLLHRSSSSRCPYRNDY